MYFTYTLHILINTILQGAFSFLSDIGALVFTYSTKFNFVINCRANDKTATVNEEQIYLTLPKP